MRFAVSGTHCSGKSTLIADFLAAHPHYVHVPEPYETLSLEGAAFHDRPEIDDFIPQLERSIEDISRTPDANVIFERSPVDFLAYLQALAGRHGEDFDIAGVLDEVNEAVQALDLIVFLPLEPGDEISRMDAEYPVLRRAVDRGLKRIFRDDSLGLFAFGKPRVEEITGTAGARLAALERAITASG